MSISLSALVPGAGLPPSLPAQFGQPPVQSGPGSRDDALWAAAEAMEASFLSLMLEDAGVGAVPSAFGGGEGEEHFASFLRDAQAREMVAAGGIGLAQSLFEAMKGRDNV